MRNVTFDVAMVFEEREDSQLLSFSIVPLSVIGLMAVMIGLYSPMAASLFLAAVSGLSGLIAAWQFVAFSAFVIFSVITVGYTELVRGDDE